MHDQATLDHKEVMRHPSERIVGLFSVTNRICLTIGQSTPENQWTGTRPSPDITDTVGLGAECHGLPRMRFTSVRTSAVAHLGANT